MEQRPALRFCVLLSTGILTGAVLPAGPLLLFWLVAVAFAAAIVFALVAGIRPEWTTASTAALVVLFGALLAVVHDRTLPEHDPAWYIGPDTVTVSGSIADVPPRSGLSLRFIMECDSIVRTSTASELSGRIVVVLSGRAADDSTVSGRIAPGRRVTVRAPLREIEGPRNPGEVDWGAHYRLAGIRARLAVRSAGFVDVGGRAGEGFVNRFVVPVREALSRRISTFVDDREARFLNGLVLGERNEVPTDLRADFITVGVMHLLAISGQQVVLVAMLIAGLLAMLRVPEKPRFILVALALAWYVLLTGASASVTRAGIMSIVMLGARVVQRKADILNALGIAASAILLWDPRQLVDPGFLLSFSAVLAIVLLYPVVLRAAPGLTARCERNRFLDLAWKGTAVSLAAGAGTAPIVAYFFGRVSLVGFIANLAIVPLSSVALVLGLLTLGASFVWDWLASVYGAAAELSASLTFRLVGFFSDMPYASVEAGLSLVAMATVYAVLVLVLGAAARKSWAPIIIAVLLAANVGLYAGMAGAPRPNVLRVTFLDVGQGDAALVEFPGGRTMLVDAGPRGSSFDAGARTIVPFLHARGIARIDRLVISHPHGDHLGGAEAVLSALPVGETVEGDTGGEGSMVARFGRLADSLGVVRRQACAGERIDADSTAHVYVLSPPGGVSGEPSEGLNDRSVVLLLRFGGTTVLFPGDAEEGAEAAMVSRYGDALDADILKAGHHGSRTSSTPAFVGAVRPAWTVISSGEGNRFGHPSPAVVARLELAGSEILRTDRQGAVVFESDGVAWSRVEWRQ